MLDRIKQSITGPLVRYLVRSNRKYVPFSVSSPELLEAVLQPADIILVEGNQRFSTAVKYPTRAICSTRIAEAFQSIAYPILPHIEREVLHIRHHSLFTPRDFDVSPYFKVIKPTIEKGFDFRQLDWNEELESEMPHRSRLVG